TLRSIVWSSARAVAIAARSSVAPRTRERRIAVIVNPPMRWQQLPATRSIDLRQAQLASRRGNRRGNHHPFPAEVGDVLFSDAEIIREQMAGCLREPVRQAAFVVGSVVQHADDLGIFRPDILDRVSAVARNVGALAR